MLIFAIVFYNQSARMGRGYHIGDDLRMSVCRWAVSGEQDVDNALGQVFALANADDRPNGKVERSLSVGDVIILDENAYSVEDVGFRRIALSIER